MGPQVLLKVGVRYEPKTGKLVGKLCKKQLDTSLSPRSSQRLALHPCQPASSPGTSGGRLEYVSQLIEEVELQGEAEARYFPAHTWCGREPWGAGFGKVDAIGSCPEAHRSVRVCP